MIDVCNFMLIWVNSLIFFSVCRDFVTQLGELSRLCFADYRTRLNAIINHVMCL